MMNPSFVAMQKIYRGAGPSPHRTSHLATIQALRPLSELHGLGLLILYKVQGLLALSPSLIPRDEEILAQGRQGPGQLYIFHPSKARSKVAFLFREPESGPPFLMRPAFLLLNGYSLGRGHLRIAR